MFGFWKNRHEEEEFEIGRDEAWFANRKREYDEGQYEGMEVKRRDRTHIDSVLAQKAESDQAKDAIAIQALQLAVETANMVAKQSIRHTDVASDRKFNVEEQDLIVEEILKDEQAKTALAKIVAEFVRGEIK
jgi:hypothetical protein